MATSSDQSTVDTDTSASTPDGLRITISLSSSRKFSEFSHHKTQQEQFSLSIPNALLQRWYLNKKAEDSYIDLVNSKISVVRLAQCNRLERRLSEQACKVATKVRSLKGRKRYGATAGNYQLFVLEGEALSFTELQTQLTQTEEQLKSLMDEMSSAASRQFFNTGRQVHEVSSKQMKRKLAQCTTFAEQALWFCQSFGLQPQFVQLRKQTGSPVKLDLSCAPQQQSSITRSSHTATDSAKVQQALYILDRFAVSDEAYHELSSASDLPPLYRIKEARLRINNSLDIRQLQGTYLGAYRPPKDAIREELAKLVSYLGTHKLSILKLILFV